jgi:hypothetical protein
MMDKSARFSAAVSRMGWQFILCNFHDVVGVKETITDKFPTLRMFLEPILTAYKAVKHTLDAVGEHSLLRSRIVLFEELVKSLPNDLVQAGEKDDLVAFFSKARFDGEWSEAFSMSRVFLVPPSAREIPLMRSDNPTESFFDQTSDIQFHMLINKSVRSLNEIMLLDLLPYHVEQARQRAEGHVRAKNFLSSEVLRLSSAGLRICAAGAVHTVPGNDNLRRVERGIADDDVDDDSMLTSGLDFSEDVEGHDSQHSDDSNSDSDMDLEFLDSDDILRKVLLHCFFRTCSTLHFFGGRVGGGCPVVRTVAYEMQLRDI